MSTLGFGDEERLLKNIVSPQEAQSLVMPPPDHPPVSGPAESTPLTGNLNRPPSQATPARQGLAGHFASAPGYIKILSNGQVGYLPTTNLSAARQIDKNLKVLD